MGRQVTEMESKAQDYTAALLSCVLTLYIFCIKKKSGNPERDDPDSWQIYYVKGIKDNCYWT